jgi:hypothetical protein
MKITNLLETTVASMPEPGQKSFRSGRSETSLEEMTAGCVASVPMPMGKTIKRESGITKGIKKKMVDEGELSENDLILVPGQMSKRPSGFMSKDRNEMERIEMAKSDVVQSVKSAKTIFNILKNSDDEIEGWVQEKLAKAEDYLNTVREYLEGKTMPAEAQSASARMQKALQREKEKREYSERYAEKHFPIGKKPEQNTEPQKEVKEAGEQPDWMKDMIAMAHKMAPQDKMRERQAQRDAQAQAERQQRIQQDIENLPDLISQYNDMEAEYESMGGKNWQYADREQNLSDEERKARGMETSMRQLADRIHTAKKASEGLAESKPDFGKMFDKKIGKHNAAVVKTKKEIGTRVADIGAGGKEYNVKTDKEWDKQKGVTEMNVGKRKPKPDSYHINKDGKPVSLASYGDKDSAIKDRDEKHPGAEVHQVGSRGKVKGKFEEDKDPCWDNYKQIGMKKKNGKTVPNCVPKK